jgi:hypothetical protein
MAARWAMAWFSSYKERPYCAGRCDHWIKVKNRAPELERVKDSFS